MRFFVPPQLIYRAVEGAIELVKSLEYNEYLEHLDLRDNLLNEEEEEELLEEVAALPRTVTVLVKSCQRPRLAATGQFHHTTGTLIGHDGQQTRATGGKVVPAPDGSFAPTDGENDIITFDNDADNVGGQLQEAAKSLPPQRPSLHNDYMVSYKDRAGTASTMSPGPLRVVSARRDRSFSDVPGHKIQLHADELDAICLALEDDDGTVVELDLSDRGLGDADVEVLSGPLCQCRTVRILNLKSNNMTYDGVSTLANLMRSTEGGENEATSPFLQVVEELNVGWNDVLDRGIVSLSMALREATELRRLFVNNAALSDEAVASISDMLKCIHVEQLHLRHNSVGSDGAALLSEALNDDDSLTHLLLGWNDIGVSGIEFICDSILRQKQDQALRLLDVDGNDLGSDGAAAVSLLLRDNSSLSSIWLASNNIGDLGIDSLSDSLCHSSTLLTLDLENNGITAEGGALLAVALRHNSTLEKLWLGHNPIGAYLRYLVLFLVRVAARLAGTISRWLH